MSRNLERERSRDAARRAWANLVWERTNNVSGAGRQRNRDGGGKKSWGVNAVIIRPDKRTQKQLGGEPFGGNGQSGKRRLPSRPYRWTPNMSGRRQSQ